MNQYKFDRTAFKMHHTKDALNNYQYWKSPSLEERLPAPTYLNRVAYKYSENEPPKLDRTYFKMGNIYNQE